MPRRKQAESFNPREPHRSFLYTVNNPTDDDIARLVHTDDVVRHRSCKEIGEHGTLHLQGAITFKRGYRFTQLKKLHPRANFQVAKMCDVTNYCIKGEMLLDIKSNQGHRSDLDAVATMAANGASIPEIAREHPVTYMRNYRGLQALMTALAPRVDQFSPIDVKLFWGPPGTGKTRLAFSLSDSLYQVPDAVNRTLWFDGYLGQTTILLDDFYGGIEYSYLLKLLDGYPMTLPVKGGFVHKNWNTVIITSNALPEAWYPNLPDIRALDRRITERKKIS